MHKVISGIVTAVIVALGILPAQADEWVNINNNAPQIWVVTDLDGDGTEELVLGYDAFGLYLYDKGTLTRINSNNPRMLVVADLDGDGIGELVAGFDAFGLLVYNPGDDVVAGGGGEPSVDTPSPLDYSRWSDWKQLTTLEPSVTGDGVEVTVKNSVAFIGYEVQGSVTLGATERVATEKRTRAITASNGLTYEIVLHSPDGEQVLSQPIAGSETIQWDSTNVADGSYALSIRALDAEALDSLITQPVLVVVDNTQGPETSAQMLPVVGSAGKRARWQEPGAVDWLVFDGERHPESVGPYPYVAVPPARESDDVSIYLDAGNWLPEFITRGPNKRYHGEPSLYLDSNLHPLIIKQSTYDGKNPKVTERFDLTDGARGANFVSPRTSMIPDPAGPGFLGISVDGRLYRVNMDGSVETLAGRRTVPTVVPHHPRSKTPTTEVWATQQEVVGTFSEGIQFSQPRDLALDPFDSRFVFVADTGNHRIARVELSNGNVTTFAGVPGSSGSENGSRLEATFAEPWSVVVAPDGTVYVADKGNHLIRAIRSDGVVETLVGAGPGAVVVPARGDVQRNIKDDPLAWRPEFESFEDATIVSPHVIRLDSTGNLILGEQWTRALRYIDLDERSLEQIAVAEGNSDMDLWIDVDRTGSVGPVDDILLVQESGSTNDQVFRMAIDGTRFTAAHVSRLGFLGSDDGFGSGGATHFPTTVAIDDEGSRFAIASAYRGSIMTFRPRFGLNNVALDVDRYQDGRLIYLTGTVPGFPFGSRPALSALHGRAGLNRVGVPSFDKLDQMTDADLGAYIQSGMGGSVPRPEISGNDLANLIYYIRRSSLRGRTMGIDPAPVSADDVAPVIVTLDVTPLDDTRIQVSWTTDEPTLGFVRFGADEYYGRWTPIGSTYSTTHSAIVEKLPTGRPTVVSVVAKDEAGNQSKST